MADLVCACVSTAQDLFRGSIGPGAQHGPAQGGRCGLQNPGSAHVSDLCYCCMLTEQNVLGLDVIVHNLQHV